MRTIDCGPSFGPTSSSATSQLATLQPLNQLLLKNMTRKNMSRRGRQLKVFKVGEEFRIAIHLTIKNFRLNENLKEYAFPSSFTSTERGYVHKYCQQLGLRTKSRGQGSSRFLTVYKKEGSTIVQADAVFELGHTSQRHTLSLLQRFPVTPRERQELLPPTERDRSYGQETIRGDVSRCMGRLSSGIPMVPPRRCENEYTSFRQNLPIWGSRDEIIQMISCHQTVLISGETGSGKTTQVPQYILEHHSGIGQPCRIICTEPRRIAALTMAERVSLERDEKVGQTVGYQMRLESRISPKTLLTFCTTGVLLRTLMGGDATIATVTHIIVDELHERDRLSDFLLIVLRDLLLKFRNLKIILMSASVDVQLFCKYFSNCPLIEVPGRAYEVKAFFLEEILKGTGYETEQMRKHKKDLQKQKAAKLDTWCSVKISPEAPESTSNETDKNPDGENCSKDLNLEDLSLSSAIIDSEHVELEPHLAAAMDKIMEDLWMSGSDDFTALMNLMMTEKISVDYQHSETNVSALMLAAGRGNLEVTDQLLSLGASLHLKSANGWTAIEWANNFGHKDVEELLAGQCNYDYAQFASNTEEQTDMTEEEKLLLEAYTLSIEEEKIDQNLVMCLIERICKSQEDGAILVFLPGYDDIVSLREKIDDALHGVMVLPLHSQMQTADQKSIFRPPPPGLRKIVLSTNIAETSITINDVVFVIDCGKVKEKTYDALMGASQLKAGWISKASAVQRRGRAGRCRPGICYHMYSKARFNSFQKFQVPEILRTPIHELCLQAKLLAPPNAPIADFLAKAPDPPPFMVTRNAVTLLKTIDALDPWEELTELGLHLLDLPIEPRLGKMVLYAVVLKCLDPVLTVVCSLAYRDPFILPNRPADKRAVCERRKFFANDTFSDHMVLLRVFQEWQKEKPENRNRFCKRNFLSHAVLEMISGMRSQLLGQLRASGFIRVRGSGDIRDLNANSEIWAVVKAALCAGTYPNLIRIDRDRRKLITQKESKVRFHHTSVLNDITTMMHHRRGNPMRKTISDLPSDWLIYEEMMRTGSTAHAYCCSLITPITVALFSGPARLPLDAIHEPNQDYTEEEDSGDDSKYDNQKATFKIDDWISFRVDPEIARLVLQLRQKWHALFLKRMHNPAKPLVQADEAVIRAVCGVLLAEDVALNLPQPSGIGQRPRSMDHFSLSDIGKSTHSSPNHRNYSNFYNPNDIFNPNDDQRMFSGSPSGATSFGGSYGACSPIPRPVPQSFSTNQQMPQMDVNSSSSCNYRIAYFIIKANTSRVVEISMAKNIFAFSPVTERKLLSAVKDGKTVILIFSIQGSGHFQGFARFTPHLADYHPPEFCSPNLGSCYQIEWLKKANVPFQSTRHLQNAWNENRKVQSSRDGQELEPSAGESLCQLIMSTQNIFPREALKNNRRQMNYGRDSFQSDSGPSSRNQMQWDMHSANSSHWSFDSPDQKYWSPPNM